MRLANFLESNTQIYKNKTKVVTLWGGTDSSREYVLRLVEKQLEVKTKRIYFLSEVKDSLWELLTYLPYDAQIVFWGKNDISEDVLAKLLIRLGKVEHATIFIDPTDQLASVYRRKDVPRSGVRRQIRCNVSSVVAAKRKKDNPFYSVWLSVQEGLEASPKLLDHLKSRPESELFNLVKVLGFVGEKNANLITAYQWGVLWADEEYLFSEGLLMKGRGYALKLNWESLNASKVLWSLFYTLNLLLKIKTLEQGYVKDRAERLGISQNRYFVMQKKAEKFNLKWLYKKLYLVISLLKWRQDKGVLCLLLYYW